MKFTKGFKLIVEKLSALMTESYLNERAKRCSRAKYEAILAKVPDIEPEAYDKVPSYLKNYRNLLCKPQSNCWQRAKWHKISWIS